jgi:hypothetical protein
VKGKRTITFTAFDKFPITATLDNRNLIEHVEALVDIGFTGDTVLDGTYSEYRSLDGVQMPMHIVMREGGWPTLEITVAQARPNSQEAIDTVARATSAAPAGAAAAAARLRSRSSSPKASGSSTRLAKEAFSSSSRTTSSWSKRRGAMRSRRHRSIRRSG